MPTGSKGIGVVVPAFRAQRCWRVKVQCLPHAGLAQESAEMRRDASVVGLGPFARQVDRDSATSGWRLNGLAVRLRRSIVSAAGAS